MTEYYDKNDLADFKNLGDSAPDQAQKFHEYHKSSMSTGKLSEKERALITLACALTQKCPYCIDTYTNLCLRRGISKEEMAEVSHLAATVSAGAVLTHSLQMRKIIKEKSGGK